ncbi:helix-turn-helix transcriptional regulator [Deinococcus hopiensis]|uniref:DNA-binding response regulator, NarL/FixJ family, contains REC and HTH domains n=1 Tax=Deinococcus hopiensis KR-140 TaxID=695939 RepID=A0A1W1VEV5_9DEIO|nr:response regulator transcription factor [Deinococcus hopiensis]SMB91591.1 DNA-binding response regulator, NarL/FixJ family, contains REC and HTH domains [Deinococcus hopiensis KR-140]
MTGRGEGAGLSQPTVAVALRSPALQAGVEALLRGFGLGVIAGSEADVLVLDDAGLAEGDALRTLQEGGVGVVVLGSAQWSGPLAEALEGGWAVLGPDCTPAELLAGVLAAAAGLVALPPETLAALGTDGEEEPPIHGDVLLTPRERDVLALLAGGLSNKRAARELGVSESTVKFHVQAVYSKLGVQSRAGAVTRGVQLGLISV